MTKMLWPISPATITQKFGENPQIYKQFGLAGHNGIDFRTKFIDSLTGKRPATAAMDGKVIEVGDEGKGGYGRFVRLRHGGSSQTVYGHLDVALVKVGDLVHAGDRIGITDNTGFSTGSHLHFGFRPDEWEKNINNGFKGYVDPLPYLEGRVVIQDNVTSEFAKQWAGWLVIVPELGGELWYVNPKTLKRYKLSGGAKSDDAAILARDGAWIGMTIADLLKIPTA